MLFGYVSRIGVGAFLCLLLPLQGVGQTSDKIETICLSDEPLLADDSNGKIEGIFVDLFHEAATRIDRTIAFERQPWKRCQVFAEETAGIGLGPLTRTSRREGKFSWVAPLFPMRVIYITLAGTGKTADTLEAVRELSVGVKEGSVSTFIAQQHEIPADKLVTVGSQELLLRMLVRGRIDAWQVWDVIGHRVIQLHRHDDELAGAELVEGMEDVLGQLWLAASPGVSDTETTLWRGAFDSMRADGTLTEIITRHLGPDFKLQPAGEPRS